MILRKRYGIRWKWKRDTWAELSLLLFLISFLGWCLEKLARYVLYDSLGDRGFLSLPLCPIYGFALILLYLSAGTPARLRYIPKRTVCASLPWRAVNQLGYALWCVLLPTALELSVGAFFRYGLGVILWDYSAEPWNLWGLICLRYSLLWGVLIYAFMALCWDRLAARVRRLSPAKKQCVAIILWGAVLADTAFNGIYYTLTGVHFTCL